MKTSQQGRFKASIGPLIQRLPIGKSTIKRPFLCCFAILRSGSLLQSQARKRSHLNECERNKNSSDWPSADKTTRPRKTSHVATHLHLPSRLSMADHRNKVLDGFENRA